MAPLRNAPYILLALRKEKMSKPKNIVSVLTGLLSGKRTGVSPSASNAASLKNSSVELDKTVINPRLVAAIYKYRQHQTDETAEELLEEMKSASFLVGAISEKPLTQRTAVETLFLNGDDVWFITATENNNQKLLALFTDYAELKHFTNQTNSAFVIPTKEAMKFVLDKGYDGLLINPAGDFLRFDSSFIRDVIDGF
jgi:hypothetical protein